MPTFLSDPPDRLYIAMFILMLATLGIWWRYRTRKALLAAGAGVGLFLLLLLVDKLFDSPREIVIRTAGEFQTDFNTGEWAKFEKHIAEDFDRGGKKKKDVKAAFDFAKSYNAKVALWSFNRDDVVVNGDTITVGFDAKPEGPEAEAYHRYVKGSFKKGPTGKWQLANYTTYKVLNHGIAEEIGGGW